jgi:Glucosidase II beta subunit-like protein
MIYDRGAQCWNGPQRSARIDLECGAENLVLKVTEPSKCEYYIKMKSPAVCLPPKKNGKKDEL